MAKIRFGQVLAFAEYRRVGWTMNLRLKIDLVVVSEVSGVDSIVNLNPS